MLSIYFLFFIFRFLISVDLICRPPQTSLDFGAYVLGVMSNQRVWPSYRIDKYMIVVCRERDRLWNALNLSVRQIATEGDFRLLRLIYRCWPTFFYQPAPANPGPFLFSFGLYSTRAQEINHTILWRTNRTCLYTSIGYVWTKPHHPSHTRLFSNDRRQCPSSITLQK